MAWIRTATSLITFGFALYKFFFYLREAEGTKLPAQMLGPRGYGLVMIGIGIFTLTAATIRHRLAIKTLRERQSIPISLATIVAGLIAILGLLAFAAAIFRE
jgi:putative membrane protein